VEPSVHAAGLATQNRARPTARPEAPLAITDPASYAWRLPPVPTFLALDFETADHGRDSACSIGIVRVESRRIVAREHRLIRPPRRGFVFTYIHGIAWSHVAEAPTFSAVWRSLAPVLAGADFFVAHNASFDRSVLHACCDAAGLARPALRFECTMKLARAHWQLHPTTLPDVCRHLRIPLRHHHALSDAEACARIMLAVPT
jgi:DNA polymerase III subunit epsilon